MTREETKMHVDKMIVDKMIADKKVNYTRFKMTLGEMTCCPAKHLRETGFDKVKKF